MAAAADINDALVYRYVPDKQAIVAALTDEASAVFQTLPKPPDQAPLPLDQLLELIGTGFVHTARANMDLVTSRSCRRQPEGYGPSGAHNERRDVLMASDA